VIVPFPCVLPRQKKAVSIQRIDTKGTYRSNAGVMSSTNPLMTRSSTSFVSGQSCDQFYELTIPSHFLSVLHHGSLRCWHDRMVMKAIAAIKSIP
jgi:hypothetical protein